MFEPRCKLDGSFSKLQCWSSDCWCVDKNGVTVDGTMSKSRKDCPDGMLLSVLNLLFGFKGSLLSLEGFHWERSYRM